MDDYAEYPRLFIAWQNVRVEMHPAFVSAAFQNNHYLSAYDMLSDEAWWIVKDALNCYLCK